MTTTERPYFLTADPAFLTPAELNARAAFAHRAPTALEREGREPLADRYSRTAWLDAVKEAPNLDAVIALLERPPVTIRRRDWADGVNPRDYCGWREHGGDYGFVRIMAAGLVVTARAFSEAAGKARSVKRIDVARAFLGAAYGAALNGGVKGPDLREIEILTRAYL